MRDFLEAMARSSAGRAAAARSREPEAALERRARAAAPPPPLRLDPAGFDLIAEIKHRSPSAGRLAPRATPADVAARAAAYARGGAAAVSVLTEPDAFDGALAHLEAAARGLPVPALRKDFLVDPYQVLEARAAGAGGVLLVLRLLDDARARELLAAAGALGLFVLLESFDEEDLGRAAALVPAGAPGTVLLGVNARDLADLSSGTTRHARLARAIPPGRPRVAESGIADAAAVRRAVRDGYGLALAGEALMRAPEPAATVAEWIAAGRAEAGTR
jgi:indole-3-glycerol phosphate synthase